MKFEYKDYQLELDVTLDKEGSIYWKATCDKLSNFSFCFSPGLFRCLEGAISKFKQEVDRFLTINEIEAQKNMTMTTQQDQDVIQVNGFLKTLDSIVSEMELIEDSDIKILILDVKLKKVAELYKTFLPFRDDLDSYRNYYAYVKAQKEKSNKKEQSTYNWVTRKELYKLNLTTHNLIKILTVDENGIPQFYWTPSDKFPEKPNTYSPNWYYKEGSTYFIYTKPVDIQEIKIDQYVTGFVNPDGKVVYYDQYL